MSIIFLVKHYKFAYLIYFEYKKFHLHQNKKISCAFTQTKNLLMTKSCAKLFLVLLFKYHKFYWVVQKALKIIFFRKTEKKIKLLQSIVSLPSHNFKHCAKLIYLLAKKR